MDGCPLRMTKNPPMTKSRTLRLTRNHLGLVAMMDWLAPSPRCHLATLLILLHLLNHQRFPWILYSWSSREMTLLAFFPLGLGRVWTSAL